MLCLKIFYSNEKEHLKFRQGYQGCSVSQGCIKHFLAHNQIRLRLLASQFLILNFHLQWFPMALKALIEQQLKLLQALVISIPRLVSDQLGSQYSKLVHIWISWIVTLCSLGQSSSLMIYRQKVAFFRQKSGTDLFSLIVLLPINLMNR